MSEKDKEITSTDASKEDNGQSDSSKPETQVDFDEAAADSAFESEEPEGESSQPQASQSDNSNGGVKAIKWFVLLIVLAAIAYAIYFGWQKWQQYQTNSQKADQVDQLQSQLEKQQQHLDRSLQQQSQELEKMNNALSQSQVRIEQLQQQLHTTQRKIQAQTSDKQQDWLFNEAEYLLREASHKLNFTNDAASIIALLKAADDLIAELNNGSYTTLRQAISSDINAIRGSGNLDIEGIAIALETLKDDINQLELASVQLDSKPEQTSESDATTDISSWQHFKNSVTEAASKYYTVHHFEESVRPFISPQKAHLLRENIALNLQTAQLAALQNNQALYQANLEQVKGWVSDYFKQKPASTSAFQQQLDELLNESVELDLPASLDSFQLISELSQQKVNSWLQQETPEDKASAEEPAQAAEEPST
ncbi:uroporphyrinogen-III C-methyltransferase [Kangiella shandongensis]|uniref:uroporphyrinogen-III C-methyltransferase n=1 Tax=Kangiella shandongensis TaxID=2763258 RepID=UPI001CC05C1C|nr:uroporphyrinogen-III C-methyltransferase [Kangiella shandongensis]